MSAPSPRSRIARFAKRRARASENAQPPLIVNAESHSRGVDYKGRVIVFVRRLPFVLIVAVVAVVAVAVVVAVAALAQDLLLELRVLLLVRLVVGVHLQSMYVGSSEKHAYCTVLYCTVMYGTVLYCTSEGQRKTPTVRYCTVRYGTVHRMIRGDALGPQP
eukprot:2023063-Pyramimonas_sp.AAC.1